jgi:hypothetical protein
VETRFRQYLLFVLLCALFAGTTLVWLHLNRAPPTWDEAIYLSSSLRLYDALVERGIAGYVRAFESIFVFRAPLITALPTPFYLALGRRWHAAFLINIVAMFALFAAVYRLTARSWNRRAALLAICIVGTMPLLYGLSRWFMVEYSLTAVVAVAMCILVESRDLKRSRAALLLGLIFGLALLLKVSFALYLAPAFLYTWLRSEKRWPAIALVMAPCMAIVVPWYATHLRPLIANALDAGYGQSAVLQGTGPVFSLAAIARYLIQVAKEGTSNYYAAVAILLTAVSLASARGRSFLGNLMRENGFVLLWIAPFVAFVFVGNKDIRYIAPVLPAFAIFLAAASDHAVPSGRIAAAILCFVSTFPVLHMLSISFGFPVRAAELGYALHSDHAPWPLDQILADVADRCVLKPGGRPVLLVGTDAGRFNADNVDLTVAANNLPLRVAGIAHQKDMPSLRERIALASFFLYKEGGEPENALINPHFAEVVQAIRNDRSFSEIGRGRNLPDGGIARIFQHSSGPSRLIKKSFLMGGLDIPETFAVNFGGVVELTGLAISSRAGQVDLKLRWRSRAPAELDYWCFVHIVDAEDKILAQRDHPLLDGNPALRSWQPGDIGVEEVHLELRPETLRGARLKLGVYDPGSGNRLEVMPLRDSALSRFSLADRATAVIAHDSL